jgi:tetratricopeptide (TPR) repeat protein
MIFPSEALQAVRSELEDRVAAGELSEAEAYREALSADPEDPRALRLLALLAEEEGDFATAETLAWRWLRADPLSHEVFGLIGRLLRRDPARAATGAAYQALGEEKLHFDPESERESPPNPPTGDEPAEVSRELEPHRLLHTMWVAGPDEVERTVIERVLARGADMLPFLAGVLNLYGEDLLEEIDDALVARVLPLLGEIGLPEALPALSRFIPLEDEALSGIGRWAFQRIAFRRPDAALDLIRREIPAAGPIELGAFAQQICLMPDAPGRKETLLQIASRLPGFNREEQAAAVTAMIVSAYVMEGVKSDLAASIERQYGSYLTPAARNNLKEVREQLKNEPPYIAEEDPTSIYDLCCTAFEPADEDGPGERDGPGIGRNDPCWCGSGKKYKKCHLAADEGR